jgi:hypothetical protein
MLDGKSSALRSDSFINTLRIRPQGYRVSTKPRSRMPSSFFPPTNTTATARKTGRPNDRPESPMPTSPRQPSSHHFSGKTLKSLFTTRRSPHDEPRAASVVTSSSIFSAGGTIRTGPTIDGKETQGRMRTLMGTSKRKSDTPGTIKVGNVMENGNDKTVKQKEDRSRDGPPGTSSRLFQGTIASRSRAVNTRDVHINPPSAVSTGTVRFPSIIPKDAELKIVSSTSTDENDTDTSGLPHTPEIQPSRKKKNSLSFFLSPNKARASISGTGSGSMRPTSTGVHGRDPEETMKVRVVSNPAGNRSYLDRMRGDVKRSQTTVRKNENDRGKPESLSGQSTGEPQPTSAVDEARLDRGRPSTDDPPGSTPPSTAQPSRISSRSVQATTSTSTSFRALQSETTSVESVSLPIQSIPTTGTSTVRAQSPASIDTRPSGSRARGSGFVALDDGNHFVSRLAVTYLAKTILPELRSGRQEGRDKPNSPQAFPAIVKLKKDLIEKLRPLERMERSWGIDWMLKGKEGFKLSSRTKEKERDVLRTAISDGVLLYL